MRKSSIRLGTSSFIAAGWPATFYPGWMLEEDCLTYYATQFDTVEVDSTFHQIPPASTVKDWCSKTPSEFLFAAKAPQVVTHEKVLVDCEAEFKEFVQTMDLLGDKLGPGSSLHRGGRYFRNSNRS